MNVKLKKVPFVTFNWLKEQKERRLRSSTAPAGEVTVSSNDGKNDLSQGFYTWKDAPPHNDGVVQAMSSALCVSCMLNSEFEECSKSDNNPLLFVWDIPKEAFGRVLNADEDDMPTDSIPEGNHSRKYQPPDSCDNPWKRNVWLARHETGIYHINDNLSAVHGALHNPLTTWRTDEGETPQKNTSFPYWTQWCLYDLVVDEQDTFGAYTVEIHLCQDY